MTTRYEFGFGYGEIYRRRMHAQDEMHRNQEREVRSYPQEERERWRYESDYYDFHGAGRRSTYATEFQVQPRSPERMRDGGRSAGGRLAPRPRGRRRRRGR